MNTNNDVKWRRFIVPKKLKKLMTIYEIGMSAQNSLTVDTTRRTRENNRLLNVTKSNAPVEEVNGRRVKVQ